MTDIIVLNDVLQTFEEQAAPATKVRGYWQSVFNRLRHDPVTLGFGAIVLLIVLAAVFAPLIVLALWMGIYPASFLSPMSVSVANLIEQYETAVSAHAMPSVPLSVAER